MARTPGANAESNAKTETKTEQEQDWVAVARELGPGFAARAYAHDAEDLFVAENYAELKARRVFSAGVPADLGAAGRRTLSCAPCCARWPAPAVPPPWPSPCTPTSSPPPSGAGVRGTRWSPS